MRYTIEGSTLQSLHIDLDDNETIYSETGALLYMSKNIELTTNFQGGLGGVLKRAVTGNGIALNYFTSQKGQGEVTFATRMPGHIIPVDVHGYNGIIVQRHSFLCAPESVELKLATEFNLKGLFGGNGFIFNRLEGNGTAFLSIDGEVIEKELSVNDEIYVHPAHLAAYQASVKTELRRMQGFKNLFFGGDGMALVRVSGPGKVWLHSLTIHHLAEILAEYMPGGEGKAGVAGTVGGIVGAFLKG